MLVIMPVYYPEPLASEAAAKVPLRRAARFAETWLGELSSRMKTRGRSRGARGIGLGFLLGFLLAFPATANNPETDSLARLLRVETQDTSRVLLLKQLSYAHRNSRPDLALHYAQTGLRLARKIRFKKGEAACLNNQGLAYWLVGNLPQALTSFLAALTINEQIKYSKGLAVNLSNIGNIYAEQGDQRASLRYTFRALAIQQAIHDDAGVTLQLLNLGASYEQLNRLDSALLYSHRGYKMALQRGDAEYLGIALTNLGSIYAGQHQPLVAMRYYRLGVPYLHQVGSDDGLCVTYLSIADLFREQHQVDSMLRYTRLSLVTGQRGGFSKQILAASRVLMDYFKSQHRPDSAFRYLELVTVAKDSLFSQEKLQHVQRLLFAENIRQQEMRAAAERAQEARVYNLEMLGIAIFILSLLVMLVLLSRRLATTRAAGVLGLVALLLVFEFISILTGPTIEDLTHNSPVLMLLTMMGLALLLAPVHHKLEQWVKRWLTQRRAGSSPTPAKVLPEVNAIDSHHLVNAADSVRGE